MNQSTGMAVLVASAVGEVFAKLESCAVEVQAEVQQLVGSFFGGRSVPGSSPGIRTADARACT
jgi:hypothetical protein